MEKDISILFKKNKTHKSDEKNKTDMVIPDIHNRKLTLGNVYKRHMFSKKISVYIKNLPQKTNFILKVVITQLQ